jgi:hypothetical protein
LKKEFDSSYFKLNNAVTHFDPPKKEKVFALTSAQLKDLALTSVGINTGLCFCIDEIQESDIDTARQQIKRDHDLTQSMLGQSMILEPKDRPKYSER